MHGNAGAEGHGTGLRLLLAHTNPHVGHVHAHAAHDVSKDSRRVSDDVNDRRVPGHGRVVGACACPKERYHKHLTLVALPVFQQHTFFFSASISTFFSKFTMH